ncbi:alpha/beta hydrolase [Phenylobacterium sp. LjRoot219]|uniref:alpha/beta fold hydrolase n=1 Tax=Phenylobacterium sp. LjRoot219 TaxID=3342283 RepID=UPI003ECC908F
MPSFTTRDGCRLQYALRGAGPLVALTPGGREAGAAVDALAEALAAQARVLTWDRRNTGASDVFFGGAGSEQELWADDLGDLIAELGEGPAWLAGGSAGCRVSVLTALRRPEAARGLILWSASGGPYGCQFLGFQYHVPYIMAAERGGMPAIAKTPFFAERIAANPENRDRLLALDPADFIATLKRWNTFFYYSPDAALAGVPDAALRGLALPTLIFEGGDDIHPPEVSQALARLIPGATLVPSAWPGAAWMDRFTGRAPGSVFDLYPRLAPAIADFLNRPR